MHDGVRVVSELVRARGEVEMSGQLHGVHERLLLVCRKAVSVPVRKLEYGLLVQLGGLDGLARLEELVAALAQRIGRLADDALLLDRLRKLVDGLLRPAHLRIRIDDGLTLLVGHLIKVEVGY